MEIPVLKAVEIFDPEIESCHAIIASVKDAAGIHRHDFYEFFLVTRGRLVHCVNGGQQVLSQGDLVFVRPGDVHHYEVDGDSDGQFINMAYSSRLIAALFAFLDDPKLQAGLVAPGISPCHTLSEMETAEFQLAYKRLNTILHKDKTLIGAEMKRILLNVVTRYLRSYSAVKDHSVPSWIGLVYRQMTEKENFTAGVARMLEISGKSHEHLCREFRKHTGKTPTAFVNELRLNYARNLLAAGGDRVLDIAMEAGFENLSHFYHLFRKAYGISPAEMRLRFKPGILLP